MNATATDRTERQSSALAIARADQCSITNATGALTIEAKKEKYATLSTGEKYCSHPFHAVR